MLLIMFFFILNKCFNNSNSKELNNHFVIICGSILYILLTNYFYINYLSLIIPLDLFLTYQNNIKNKDNNTESIANNSKKPKMINKPLLVENKISVNETISHTFKNIGLNENLNLNP